VGCDSSPPRRLLPPYLLQQQPSLCRPDGKITFRSPAFPPDASVFFPLAAGDDIDFWLILGLMGDWLLPAAPPLSVVILDAPATTLFSCQPGALSSSRSAYPSLPRLGIEPPPDLPCELFCGSFFQALSFPRLSLASERCLVGDFLRVLPPALAFRALVAGTGFLTISFFFFGDLCGSVVPSVYPNTQPLNSKLGFSSTKTL